MKEKPTFTIVIPTYGRPRQLTGCLESLSALEFPSEDMEVVIVDDGSEAPAHDIVSEFQNRLALRMIVQQHAGPATARNRGVEKARGTFIAFTDDDCRPERDWLLKLKERFAVNPDWVVAGNTVNALEDNPYAAASQAIIDYLNSYYNVKDARFMTSNNLALSRERFMKIGGFDTSFPLAAAEDREFCDRCIHYGYETVFAPEVVVRHAHALTASRFLRQHYNYGRGADKFHRIRAGRTSDKFKIEPLHFYTNLLGYPWKTSGKNKPFVALLIFMSQAANLAGFFREKLGRPKDG